jgi:hypothetical protein
MPTDSKCPAQPSEFSFPSSVTPESGKYAEKGPYGRAFLFEWLHGSDSLMNLVAWEALHMFHAVAVAGVANGN